MNNIASNEESECAICLCTVNPDENASLKCCKAIIHRHCYLQCINKHGSCPWCRKAIPSLKLFFLGFDRWTDTGIFDKYISNIPVNIKLEIHQDMGPWSNLDEFVTVSQKKNIYKKQIEASDLILVNLNYPRIDYSMLEYAINRNKIILIVEKPSYRSQKTHHKYYKHAQMQATSIDESLFHTVDPIRELYFSKNDYIENITLKKIQSGPFLIRLKKRIGI